MTQRYAWMFLAVAFMGLAVWTMPSVKPPPPITTPAKKPVVADKPSTAELAQMEKRRTLPPAATPTPGVPAATAARRRDPLLVALPPLSDTVVVEINALTTSGVGRLLEACYKLSEAVDSSGLKLSDYERLAIANAEPIDRLIIIAGNASRVLDERLADHGDPLAHGTYGRIYAPRSPTATPTKKVDPKLKLVPELPSKGASYLGLWKDELAFVSASRVQIERAIDRVEGRANVAPLLPDEEAYGTLYGELLAKRIATIAPSPIRKQLEASSLRVRFRVMASDEIGIKARVYGSPQAIMLGNILSARFADMRAGGAKAGDKRYVDLLDAVDVATGADDFTLTAVVARDLLIEALGTCAKGAPAAVHVMPTTPAP